MGYAMRLELTHVGLLIKQANVRIIIIIINAFILLQAIDKLLGRLVSLTLVRQPVYEKEKILIQTSCTLFKN